VKPLSILVIIPTAGKRPDMLEAALQSVRNQTRSCLVAVAASDRPLADKLNSVIDHYTCDAFIVLSDDDLLEPTFVEKTAKRMEETGVDIVHTRYTHFGNESCVTGSSNHISVTSLCRKTAWDKAKGYKNVPCFDYDFWLTCLETGAKTSFVDEPLWRYRIHGEQTGAVNLKAETQSVLDRHPWVLGKPEDRGALLK
jgi:hypothetical protein